MSEKELEKIMVTNYTNVFKAILTSEFRADPHLREDYYSSPIARQREIDLAIDIKSSRLAKSLVNRLEHKGYLAKSPTSEELGKIIREVLSGSDTKK